MSDENKEPMVDHKNVAEEAKKQLSDESLNNVSGGLIFTEEPIEYHSKGRLR